MWNSISFLSELFCDQLWNTCSVHVVNSSDGILEPHHIQMYILHVGGVGVSLNYRRVGITPHKAVGCVASTMYMPGSSDSISNLGVHNVF